MAWGGKWHLGDIRRTWRDSMWDRHWEPDLALRGQTLRTSDGTEGTLGARGGTEGTRWVAEMALSGQTPAGGAALRGHRVPGATPRGQPPARAAPRTPGPSLPFTKMAAAVTREARRFPPGGGGPEAGPFGGAMPRAAVLLWLLLPGLAALEPLSVGLAIGVASALTGYLSHPSFYCSYVECCPGAGHRLNATGTGERGGARVAGRGGLGADGVSPQRCGSSWTAGCSGSTWPRRWCCGR